MRVTRAAQVQMEVQSGRVTLSSCDHRAGPRRRCTGDPRWRIPSACVVHCGGWVSLTIGQRGTLLELAQ